MTMKIKPMEVPVAKLLLDPNNYRFLDNADWSRKQDKRFHEDPVQAAALRLMERGSYQLEELRNSILANGYVPVERVIVTPYKHKADRYLVVEGNRRVAALNTLLRDHEDGSITLNAEQLKNFSKIPIAILEGEGKELIAAERVLMGIRHIAGPREWGAYQQASFIRELVEDEGQDFGTIADHLGMRQFEVARRYRAIRALLAMKNDELYASSAKTDFYRLFHELVSNPEVRDFFGWNHEKARFESEEKARRFFEFIAPQAEDTQPKLRTFADVRKLRTIIGNRAAEAVLFDPDESLDSAYRKALADETPPPTPDLVTEVKHFRDVLEKVNIDVLRSLTDEDVAILETLAQLITTRIDDYAALARQPA
jgi:hypothetical protein